MLQVEKHIPIPPKSTKTGRPKCKLRLFMESWEVGDSYAWEDREEHELAAAFAVKVFGKGNWRAEKKNGKLRIWRTG